LALAAIAMPAINPPPPIGTTIVSTSGTSSMISSPSVPWPAITAASSNACTNAMPRAAPISFAIASASL
jgi:hypothetical protein